MYMTVGVECMRQYHKHKQELSSRFIDSSCSKQLYPVQRGTTPDAGSAAAAVLVRRRSRACGSSGAGKQTLKGVRLEWCW